MLDSEDVAACVPQYLAIHETVERQFPGASARERFQEALRRLLDALVSGLIEGTAARARDSKAADAGEVRALPERLAAFTPDTAAASRALKRFLYERVYASPALGEDRNRSTAMIADLFQLFLDHPDRLPQAYREGAAAEPPHRLVCDYIAGMTDAFFRRTYEQMFGTER
jgi:dGTPase